MAASENPSRREASRGRSRAGSRGAREAGAAREAADSPIVIELTRAQVDQVVRGASEGGVMSVLLGAGGFRARLARELGSGWPEQMDDHRLSRSLLLGLFVLALLPSDGGSMGVGEVAAMTGLSKSTSHRYMSTLVAVGLAERDPVTRKYRLASDVGDG
jgi:hypothetical protein